MTCSNTVTVCIPTLNRPRLVRRAIGSVLRNRQNGVDLELLVSVNAPDADCLGEYEDLARELNNSATVTFQSERLRADEHFRQLIMNVETDFVALLADDDWFSDDFLVQAIVEATRANAAVVFGPYVTLHADRQTVVFRDHSSNCVLWRAIKYVMRHEDGCFYGLCRTDVLKENINYLKIPEIAGTRTPLHAVYPFVFAAIVDGGYAALNAKSSPVWFNDETSTKHELPTAGKKLLVRLLWVTRAKLERHRTYQAVVRRKLGKRASALFVVPNLLRFCFEVLHLWASFGVQAGRACRTEMFKSIRSKWG